MRARKTAFLHIIFTSNQTPFLGVLSSKGIPSGRCVAHCTFEITLLQAIMLILLLVCAFSPRKYESILCGFYNAVALPGDCHVALLLAMT